MWSRNRTGAAAGEKLPPGIGTVLARAHDAAGSELLGTRRAIHVMSPDGALLSRPWEQIAEAAWDGESETLTLRSTAAEAATTRHHLPDADRATRRLLQLIDERVRASIVLQRHIPVRGSLGITVVARRAPHGASALTWQVTPDVGLEAEDPSVQQAMVAARRLVADELGESGRG